MILALTGKTGCALSQFSRSIYVCPVTRLHHVLCCIPFVFLASASSKQNSQVSLACAAAMWYFQSHSQHFTPPAPSPLHYKSVPLLSCKSQMD